MPRKGVRPYPAPLVRLKDRNYPDYRYRELLATIGNDNAIRKLLSDCGFEPPARATIRGWRTRNSIPPRWLPIVLLQAVSLGALPNMASLLKGVQDR